MCVWSQAETVLKQVALAGGNRSARRYSFQSLLEIGSRTSKCPDLAPRRCLEALVQNPSTQYYMLS